MSLCWDCGPSSRPRPLAGLLERRELLRAGGKRCVEAWPSAITVAPGAVQCMACLAICCVVLDDAG